MSAAAFELPGLERIRGRFVQLLNTRKSRIAHHALAAWDAKNANDITANLEEARSILHQISGTAGTVGYPDLGILAQQCEARIIAHTEGPDARTAVCPDEIIWSIDSFVEACDTVTATAQVSGGTTDDPA